ncbi:MAG: VWA domain-containing protein [Eubacteriales bacterium]
MKQELTELVFILDKSGSMGGLESDTIGGFNAMLKKQQDAPGECRITTALFDNNYTLLHDRVDIRAVRPITAEEYQAGGTTALLDAIGRTIDKIVKVQKSTAQEYRAGKVMLVIITDGQENASREYNAPQIKSLITRQKEQFGWEFIFLGANIDAVETADQFGITPDRALDYKADGQGTQLNFRAIGRVAYSLRDTGAVDEAALEAIRRDYTGRKR